MYFWSIWCYFNGQKKMTFLSDPKLLNGSLYIFYISHLTRFRVSFPGKQVEASLFSKWFWVNFSRSHELRTLSPPSGSGSVFPGNTSWGLSLLQVVLGRLSLPVFSLADVLIRALDSSLLMKQCYGALPLLLILFDLYLTKRVS